MPSGSHPLGFLYHNYKNDQTLEKKIILKKSVDRQYLSSL